MEKKILSKEEFLSGIAETARVHYHKFYEKFVLSFENIEAMETTIELLVNVDDDYEAYRGAKKHFTQLFGFKNEEFELMYHIDIIKDIALSLDMYDTLSSNKDFITWE